MAVLDNIKAYVNLVNKKLTYIETTSTSYIFDLVGYQLPKTIMDKNMKKPLKERTANILLDVNQQNIGMYDYDVKNYSNSVRFTLPISNFPYTLGEGDDLQVTGTFQK